MPVMAPWKITILKLARNIPWPVSPKVHLERTLKLVNAVLYSSGDDTLKGSLARMDEALDLLSKDELAYDLSAYPDLNFERTLEQATLMNRGSYFLMRSGRGQMIFDKFNQLEIAFNSLAPATLGNQVVFGVEKMIRQIYFGRDFSHANEIREVLIAKLPSDSSEIRASVDLYYGYALCLAQNQDGARYIQASTEKFDGKLAMNLAAMNWDFGFLAATMLNNPAESACVKSIKHILNFKSKGE